MPFRYISFTASLQHNQEHAAVEAQAQPHHHGQVQPLKVKEDDNKQNRIDNRSGIEKKCKIKSKKSLVL